jgi:hypothetical protein
MDDTARAVAEEYPDHVEADGVGVRLPVREVPFGRSAYVHPDKRLRRCQHVRDVRGFRREDEEMRRTGIIQFERQAIKMAREHLRSNEEGGAA